MKKTLDVDNPFFAFMGGLADAAIVNILFLACSLPVVTMGAAAAAMYQTFRELREGTAPSAGRAYFRAFRAEFRNSFLPWMAQLFSGLLLAFDLAFVVKMEDSSFWHLAGMALGCMFLLWLLISCYLLPLAVYRGRTLREAAAKSLYLAVRNLPRTAVMAVLNSIPAVCILLGNYFIGAATPVYLTVGFGVTAWLNTALLEKCSEKQAEDDR